MSAVVLDTWLALVNAATALSVAGGTLEGVTVVDGPRVTSESDLDRLFIGVDMDPASLAAEGGASPTGDEIVIHNETFAIVCTAESWSGSQPISARRVRAFAIMDAVRPLLRPPGSPYPLGVKTLQSAWLGAWQLYQPQTSKGPYAGVSFRVECVARPSTT